MRTDLAIFSELLQNCINQFKAMRQNADQHWIRICNEAKLFAEKHSITLKFTEKKILKVKRMAGELVSKKISIREKLQEAERTFKASIFITVIETPIDIINKNLNFHLLQKSIKFHKLFIFEFKYFY